MIRLDSSISHLLFTLPSSFINQGETLLLVSFCFCFSFFNREGITKDFKLQALWKKTVNAARSVKLCFSYLLFLLAFAKKRVARDVCLAASHSPKSQQSWTQSLLMTNSHTKSAGTFRHWPSLSSVAPILAERQRAGKQFFLGLGNRTEEWKPYMYSFSEWRWNIWWPLCLHDHLITYNL